MAEAFEGPVVISAPVGQSADFEVAKFGGDVGVAETVRARHLSAEGNVSARGNVNGAAVFTKMVELSDTLHIDTGGGDELVRATIRCTATDIVAVTNLRAEGNIGAVGNVNAGDVNASGSIRAGDTIYSTHVHADGNISARGNLNASLTVNAQHVIASGNVNAQNMFVEQDVKLSNGMDCAEDFDLDDSPGSEPVPGCVMVIGSQGSVRISTCAYDTRVAGVVSGAGTFKPGIILDRRSSDVTRPTLALMGKVYCYADTTNGPIDVGDLLTTSTTPGHAMKATDPSRAFGAVIGKALGQLREAAGLIPILVALQ
jgi:hypothetical protein